jgi:hypothetical protein
MRWLVLDWTGAVAEADVERRIRVLRARHGLSRDQAILKIYVEGSQWRDAYVALFDWISRMNADHLGGEFTHGDCQAAEDARAVAQALATEVDRAVVSLREKLSRVELLADELRLGRVRADGERVALAEWLSCTEPELSSEQYADGAGALAWRQAMSGAL